MLSDLGTAVTAHRTILVITISFDRDVLVADLLSTPLAHEGSALRKTRLTKEVIVCSEVAAPGAVAF